MRVTFMTNEDYNTLDDKYRIRTSSLGAKLERYYEELKQRIDNLSPGAIDKEFGSGGSINYSTEEVSTGGKWIDKKPIYQCVFQGSLDASTTADIATNIGFETVIRLEGFLSYTSSAGVLIQRPLNYFNSTSLHSRLYTGDGDGGKIQAYSTQAGNVFVIMEYTKTGDAPIEDNMEAILDNAILDKSILA